MMLMRTTLASVVLALTGLSAATPSAHAADPQWAPSYNEEMRMRAEPYMNMKPYNYYQNNTRKRATYGTVRKKTYRGSGRKKAPTTTYTKKSRNAPGRDCTPYAGPDGYYGNPWCDGGFKRH